MNKAKVLKFNVKKIFKDKLSDYLDFCSLIAQLPDKFNEEENIILYYWYKCGMGRSAIQLKTGINWNRVEKCINRMTTHTAVERVPVAVCDFTDTSEFVGLTDNEDEY